MDPPTSLRIKVEDRVSARGSKGQIGLPGKAAHVPNPDRIGNPYSATSASMPLLARVHPNKGVLAFIGSGSCRGCLQPVQSQWSGLVRFSLRGQCLDYVWKPALLAPGKASLFWLGGPLGKKDPTRFEAGRVGWICLAHGCSIGMVCAQQWAMAASLEPRPPPCPRLLPVTSREDLVAIDTNCARSLAWLLRIELDISPDGLKLEK